MGRGRSFSVSALSLFRFHLSPFPQKRLILRLNFLLGVGGGEGSVAGGGGRGAPFFFGGKCARGPGVGVRGPVHGGKVGYQ